MGHRRKSSLDKGSAKGRSLNEKGHVLKSITQVLWSACPLRASPQGWSGRRRWEFCAPRKVTVLCWAPPAPKSSPLSGSNFHILAFYPDLILASGALREIKLYLGKYISSFKVRLSSSQAQTEPGAQEMFSEASRAWSRQLHEADRPSLTFRPLHLVLGSRLNLPHV